MIPDSAAEAPHCERELQQSSEEHGQIVDISETQPLLENGEQTTPKTTFSSFTAREWGILVMLSSANLWSIVAFSCIAPFYPMEAKKKGLSDFEIGLTFGIFELMIFLASPIAGKLMPRFGPKNLFTIGLTSTGTIAILFGFIDLIPTRREFFIASLIIRILEGIGEAAFVTSSFTINANCFPGMLSTILGILQTCGGVGFSLGPFLGGILYDIGGFRLPFYSLGVAMFLMAFLSRWLIPKDQGEKTEPHSSTGYKGLLRIPTIWIMMFALFNSAISTSFVNPAMAGHLESFHLSPPVLGLLFLLSGAFYSVTAPLNGMLVDRFKCHLGGMMVAPAAIIISLSLNGPSPLLPLTKSLPLVIIAQIIFGAGLSTLQIPTYRNTLEAAEKAGFEDGTTTYGLVSGLFEAVYSFGAFVGPTAGGLIQQHYGFAWTVTIISAFHLCFLMMFSIFYIYKKCKRKEEDINA
ncbi:transporter, major facilitator family protein [Ancylostoma caninum]|uniref:Transporter, major facilitator family protein n=1 Tax=Ancylostoma caninum TaxID=29170 RepID=A0A368GUY2_ANCCA|nr:transporter, major facilitator family protein [Ancylostoma caninum]